MGSMTTVQTAHEFYEEWTPRLSETQAENFANVKSACDALETHGGDKEMNPGSVGRYCQDEGTGGGAVSPATQTIRNMKVTFKGVATHVYRDYIKKREFERKKPPQRRKKKPTEGQPTYSELAMQIKDDLTRHWVQDLIQRWDQAEKSCDYLEKQLREKSKKVGGLNIAGAITEGADELLRLPIMSPNMTGLIEFTPELRDALEGILAIPEDANLPYLRLNDHGALVYDDETTGAVIVLSPKKWQAIDATIKGAES